MLKAIAFDFGHTVMDEVTCRELMPGAYEAITSIPLPKAVWANTREASAADVREMLARMDVARYIEWVVTSFDIGHRKPAPEFFAAALATCAVKGSDILYIGNQMNTDILGANRARIACVYLSGTAYRSLDDRPTPGAKPTYTIETLFELPALIGSLR
jgi:FMN phosphatase YigB (HAD superfamily)